jgi:hypothetical protein
MKYITYAEKSLMIGEEASAVLMEFAAKLADSAKADTVQLNAIGADGNDVAATFLHDAGVMLYGTSELVDAPFDSASVQIRGHLSAEIEWRVA